MDRRPTLPCSRTDHSYVRRTNCAASKSLSSLPGPDGEVEARLRELSSLGVEMPEYALTGQVEQSAVPLRPPVLDGEEQERLRASCSLAKTVLSKAGEMIRPGVTALEVERTLHGEIVSGGAYPSQLNFVGFPRSVSVSVNDVAVHGVADEGTTMREGDLVSVDVSTFLHGFHGDCTRTFVVGGRCDPRGRALVTAALEFLYQGISACGPGEPFTKIGRSIHLLCRRRPGAAVVPWLLGHGIGRHFHGPPDVFHVLNNLHETMLPGMAFTVEPCVAEGATRLVVPEGSCNVRMADGGRTAQFEHTLLVTEDGVDILTLDLSAV